MIRRTVCSHRWSICRSVVLFAGFGESFRDQGGTRRRSCSNRRSDQERTAAFIMFCHELTSLWPPPMRSAPLRRFPPQRWARFIRDARPELAQTVPFAHNVQGGRPQLRNVSSAGLNGTEFISSAQPISTCVESFQPIADFIKPSARAGIVKFRARRAARADGANNWLLWIKSDVFGLHRAQSRAQSSFYRDHP